jgi:hypothetical protein
MRVWRVAGAWLAFEAVLVGLTVAWIAFYSYAIDAGHEPGFYQDYARRVSQIFASWNHTTAWLRAVDSLRHQ